MFECILCTPQAIQLAAATISELVNNLLESMPVITVINLRLRKKSYHFWVLTAVEQEAVSKMT
jgi:hypothetical protein